MEIIKYVKEFNEGNKIVSKNSYKTYCVVFDSNTFIKHLRYIQYKIGQNNPNATDIL